MFKFLFLFTQLKFHIFETLQIKYHYEKLIIKVRKYDFFLI